MFYTQHEFLALNTYLFLFRKNRMLKYTQLEENNIEFVRKNDKSYKRYRILCFDVLNMLL